MTPRRRLAAATLGAALLGGTLAAAPATAQQREYTNTLSTPAVPTDLDVATVGVDANRSTLTIRFGSQNLGDDFNAVAYVTEQKKGSSGKLLIVDAVVSDGDLLRLTAGTVADAGGEFDPVDLPDGSAQFVRRGNELVFTVKASAIPWSGPVHVGGRLDSPDGSRFVAESFDFTTGTAPTFFGPITTAADPTTTTLGLSSSRQVYGQTRPTVLTAKVPAGVAGSVTFRDGARTLGVVKQAGGTARLTLPRTLLAGAHTLTATFVPTDRTHYSTSTAATWLTVAPQATTTAVRLSKTKQRLRGSKPARATITVSGRAAGTVTVYDGRRKLRTIRLSAGRATYTLPRTLTAGRHSIKAVYRPATAGTYAASTSRTVRLTVTR